MRPSGSSQPYQAWSSPRWEEMGQQVHVRTWRGGSSNWASISQGPHAAGAEVPWIGTKAGGGSSQAACVASAVSSGFFFGSSTRHV